MFSVLFSRDLFVFVGLYRRKRSGDGAAAAAARGEREHEERVSECARTAEEQGARVFFAGGGGSARVSKVSYAERATVTDEKNNK